MKVVVLTTSYPRGPDDVAGVFVQNAVEHLRAAGMDVTVVSPASFRHYGLAYGAGIVGNIRRKPWKALLTPLFINVTLLSTILSSERQMGDQTIEMDGKIRIAGQPEIALSNRFAGNQNAAVAAALSVAQPLGLLLGSGFKNIAVDGVDVEIHASEQKEVGTLTSLRVEKTRVAGRPG